MSAVGDTIKSLNPHLYSNLIALKNGEYELFPPRRIYAEKKIHHTLKRLFVAKPGYFIEAGANDGIARSNTYYLEKYFGWRGLLVEPIPHRAEECRRNRPKSITVHSALVSPSFERSSVEIVDMDRMSMIRADGGAIELAAHMARYHDNAARYGKIAPRVVTHDVPAHTLSDLIDANKCPPIDFFSLDVEGLELQVLQGLDFDRHAPTYILVEDWDKSGVSQYLQGNHYALERRVSGKDALFKRVRR